MSHGLQFIAHYTWSRALDYTTTTATMRSIHGLSTVPTARTVRRCSCLTWFISCRFGKGKTFGGGAGKAENLIIGGWQVTTTTNYQCGIAVHCQL